MDRLRWRPSLQARHWWPDVVGLFGVAALLRGLWVLAPWLAWSVAGLVAMALAWLVAPAEQPPPASPGAST